MNNGDFALDAIMVHDVPRGNSETDQLVLTDAPIELDAPLKSYFESKINRSLGLRGVAVAVDEAQNRMVTEAVGTMLEDVNALPAASAAIARRLDEAQTAINPPGLLCVALGRAGNEPAIAILKLEREQGVRFQVQERDGKRMVDLQFLRDLTLTEKTKVFKTSVFRLEGSQLSGLVSDDQRGATTGRGVANFFLRDFLGCKLAINPAQATFEFVKATEQFFNGSVTNPEKRGQYQVALLATMQSQQLDISPAAFAAEHLDAEDRSRMLDHLRAADIDPGQAFEKDLSIIRVQGFRMSFENGMVLVGSSEDLEHRVAVRSEDAEVPGVDINDAVKELRGR